MRVGLMFPPAADPAEVMAIARRAEECGFHYFACGEHLFFHGPVPNAFVTLAAAAAVTSRIRVLSALTILPTYPAVLAAKQAATLDRVAAGRFDLGIGIGGEYPPEFAAAGVPVRERARRTDEALTVLGRLFGGDVVDFSGEFTHVPGLRLDPAPVQRGGPPVWIGGRREAALRRVARFGDVWLPYLVTPRDIADGLARLVELRDELELERPPARGAYFGWSAIDRSAARARSRAIEVIGRTYKQDFEPLADRYLVAGCPSAVTDQLGEYAECGAADFIFAPAVEDQTELWQMIELFASEVLPQMGGSS